MIEPGPVRRVPWLATLPLLAFVVLVCLFAKQLLLGGDVARLPSALVGHAAPALDLPELAGSGRPALTAAALRAGRVTIVNVFASWCIPCRAEQAALMQLAQDPTVVAAGVQIVGLSYKDTPQAANGFLRLGNPYGAIGVDANGGAGIEWGVYGVPETFVVRGDGTITYKLIGEVTPANIQTQLLPEIRKAITP